MKRNLKLIISASAASVLTFSALAQEAGQARELDRRELLESRQGDSRQAARRADRLTAVPPGALHHDVALGILHLDADKETLTASPEFDMA